MKANIEELRKFDKMTKPTPFRHIRMLKQVLHRDVIKYWFYNKLYKLHLLKRYTYRTVDEGNFHAPDFNPQNVTTDNFFGTVICKLSEITTIEQDYFYKEKNGVKKILYTVLDNTEVRKMMTCYLDGVCLRLDGKIYSDRLPVVKVAILEDFGDFCSPPSYKEVTYDLTPVKNLRSRTILNSFNIEEVTYSYSRQCTEFMKAMSRYTLKDLEV